MILLAETNITIDRPTEQLFDYVTNMENYGEWFPGVTAIHSKNDLPHGKKGKTYQELIIMPDGEDCLIIQVKDCVQNERFYTEGDLKPLLPAMQMEFDSATEDSTHFRLKYFSRNKALQDSEILTSIKENLAERILVAAHNLKNKFN